MAVLSSVLYSTETDSSETDRRTAVNTTLPPASPSSRIMFSTVIKGSESGFCPLSQPATKSTVNAMQMVVTKGLMG